jgi:hypothetical protein
VKLGKAFLAELREGTGWLMRSKNQRTSVNWIGRSMTL